MELFESQQENTLATCQRRDVILKRTSHCSRSDDVNLLVVTAETRLLASI